MNAVAIIFLKMSKWNKSAQAPSQQFLENQQRRKQIIMQAAKRRKEKQRRLQEQEQQAKKINQAALNRHKQEQKEAYNKYLKANMHDKYQDIQRKKKEEQDEIKPTGKWKKKGQDSATPNRSSSVQHRAWSPQVLEPKKQQRRQIIKQFQMDWQDQMGVDDELLTSKLLDSLDLDIGTLNRDIQVKQLTKKKTNQKPKNQAKHEQISQIRNIIGYESFIMNQFAPKNKEASKRANTTQETRQRSSKEVKQPKSKPDVNQVQVFNQLKHKKETKILQWAIYQQQEAQDLFSNCSSRKKSNKTLQKINQQIRMKNKKKPAKGNLDTINQEMTNNNDQVQFHSKNSTHQQPKSNSSKKKSKEIPSRTSAQKKTVLVDKRPSSAQKKANTSYPGFKKQPKTKVEFQMNKEEQNIVQPQTGKKYTEYLQPSVRVRTKSRQAIPSISNDKKETIASNDKYPRQTKQLKEADRQKIKQTCEVIPQPVKKIFGKIPPLPKQTANSIATHQIQIDVQSFIRNDLLNLNQQERHIQQELRDLHKGTKDQLNNAYLKHEIKANYKRSQELTGYSSGHPYSQHPQEADIEESLQNLDNYLIRKEQQKTENQLKNDSHSIIDPFSNSEALCNQILQLAKNVSRFDKPLQEDANGYAHMKKIKQQSSELQDKLKASKNNTNQIQKQQKNHLVNNEKRWQVDNEDDEDDFNVSQQLSQMGGLPRPPLILQPQQLRPKEKMHVNAKLLKGLLLND